MAVQSGLGFEAFGEQDYTQFAAKVQHRFRVRLADYRAEQMQRRICTMAQRNGFKSFVEYFGGLEKVQDLANEFMNEITINVTELLRNKNLFENLFRDVIPGLVEARAGAPLSVWSAGCSYGAEAYTLAMLLSEAIPSGAFRIRGTDIDLTILARANSPSFNENDMVNVCPERRKKFFMTPDDKTYIPLSALRNKVQFSPHDLLADPYVPTQYDLILCRNVLIYFTDEAKERVYRGFFQSLRPGGVLFIGGTERLINYSDIGYNLIAPFFYRKPENAVPASLRAA